MLNLADFFLLEPQSQDFMLPRNKGKQFKTYMNDHHAKKDTILSLLVSLTQDWNAELLIKNDRENIVSHRNLYCNDNYMYTCISFYIISFH